MAIQVLFVSELREIRDIGPSIANHVTAERPIVVAVTINARGTQLVGSMPMWSPIDGAKLVHFRLLFG